MEHRITDIHCPQCAAPADFDIVRQMYVCGHCGGTVGISEAQKEKQGFRKLQREKLKNSVKKYRLFSTSCSGCGAEVVFEENEALSGCPFCGRSLVRTEYLSSKNIPESVIPFGITQKEARERLEDWCRKNRGKQEAKQLLPLISELKGFYLPYEMVRGPVHMRARAGSHAGVQNGCRERVPMRGLYGECFCQLLQAAGQPASRRDGTV